MMSSYQNQEPKEGSLSKNEVSTQQDKKRTIVAVVTLVGVLFGGAYLSNDHHSINKEVVSVSRSASIRSGSDHSSATSLSTDTTTTGGLASLFSGDEGSSTTTTTSANTVLFNGQDVRNAANSGAYQIVTPSSHSMMTQPATIVGASSGSEAFPPDDVGSGNFKTFFHDPKYAFHRILALMNDQISYHHDHRQELQDLGYSLFSLDQVASRVYLFKKEPSGSDAGIVVMVHQGTDHNSARDLQDDINLGQFQGLVFGPLGALGLHHQPYCFSEAEEAAKKVYAQYGGANRNYRIFTTGHSLGGAAAVNVAATRPDLVEACIAFDPFEYKLNSLVTLHSKLADAHSDWAAQTLREKIVSSRNNVIVHRFTMDAVSKYNMFGLSFTWKYQESEKTPRDIVIPLFGWDGNFEVLGGAASHNTCHFIPEVAENKSRCPTV